MSILKLTEESPDSKRSEHVKTVSVSFGEVFIQGSNDTGSDEEIQVTPLPSPRRGKGKGKKHTRVLIPPRDGLSMDREPLLSENSIMDGELPDELYMADIEEPYMILESRDNPFVPGSDLCKEAEEILQKATIIRDRFILRDESGEVPDTEVTSESHPNSPGNGKDCSVVEESVSPQTSAPVNTAPKARQNGKIDDNVSPTAVKVELGGARSDGLAVDAENKDKKKQKKCCSVM
ncbi:uncharacterized protein [Argopecten irradians]|uniref:uncharacterized protein isoform X6 n=1 Tax=Argopecten irradians TaxID=31199 RepID=UPI003720B395